MKQKKYYASSTKRLISISISVIVLLGLYIQSTSLVSAQEIISPLEKSQVSACHPTFVWKAAENEKAVKMYRFDAANGAIKLQFPPKSSRDKQTYTLTYNETEKTYSLRLNGCIKSGQYTWHITTISQPPIPQVSNNTAALATAAVGSFSLLQFLSQTGGQGIGTLLTKVLQAIGLLPIKRPQGLVYNSQTHEPISFARVTLTNANQKTPPIEETLVTDTAGVYQNIAAPAGWYQLSVLHQDFVFPSQSKKPSYLTQQQYYQGNPFELKEQEKDISFFIPVDPIAESKQKKKLTIIIKQILGSINISTLFLPLTIFSLVATLLFPSFINIIITSIYVLLWGSKFFKNIFKPSIIGKVVDEKNNPVSFAIVKILDTKEQHVVALLSTNKQGKFKSLLKKGTYQISVTKSGLVWQPPTGSAALSFQEIDLRQKKRATVTLQMKKFSEKDFM